LNNIILLNIIILLNNVILLNNIPKYIYNGIYREL